MSSEGSCDDLDGRLLVAAVTLQQEVAGSRGREPGPEFATPSLIVTLAENAHTALWVVRRWGGRAPPVTLCDVSSAAAEELVPPEAPEDRRLFAEWRTPAARDFYRALHDCVAQETRLGKYLDDVWEGRVVLGTWSVKRSEETEEKHGEIVE